MDFNSTCNGACTPPQIINLEMPVQDISTLKIYNECGCEYSNEVLQFAYSLDGVCWSWTFRQSGSQMLFSYTD